MPAEAGKAAIRSRWPRRVLGLLFLIPVFVVGAFLAGRRSLANAAHEFDASAAQTLAAWASRHPLRASDARARELAALEADLSSQRSGDPSKHDLLAAMESMRVTLLRAEEARPLPAPADLRAWLDSRESVLDRAVTLLTDGSPPRWPIRSDDRAGGKLVLRPLAALSRALLARALDDASRGLTDRADDDLAADWALVESWSELPAFAQWRDGDLLAAVRVVGPRTTEDWIARIEERRPRSELHDEIAWRAATLRAAGATIVPDDRRATLGDWRATPRQRPFLTIPRAFDAAREIRSLAAVDSRLDDVSPCGDPLGLARSLAPASPPPERAAGLDQDALLRLRAAEVDLALTRRVLELARDPSSAPGDACAGAWLTETRDGPGAVTVAWTGALPQGIEPGNVPFPRPFTVRHRMAAGVP